MRYKLKESELKAMLTETINLLLEDADDIASQNAVDTIINNYNSRNVDIDLDDLTLNYAEFLFRLNEGNDEPYIIKVDYNIYPARWKGRWGQNVNNGDPADDFPQDDDFDIIVNDVKVEYNDEDIYIDPSKKEKLQEIAGDLLESNMQEITYMFFSEYPTDEDFFGRDDLDR